MQATTTDARRVLLAVGSERLRSRVLRMLRAHGADVTFACGVPAAARRADDGPDAVILDDRLPNGDPAAVVFAARRANPAVRCLMARGGRLEMLPGPVPAPEGGAAAPRRRPSHGERARRAQRRRLGWLLAAAAGVLALAAFAPLPQAPATRPVASTAAAGPEASLWGVATVSRLSSTRGAR